MRRSEVRGQQSEVRGQRSEVSDQRSEFRGQRSAVNLNIGLPFFSIPQHASLRQRNTDR